MTEPRPSFAALARESDIRPESADKPVICVQGMGFVGAAMATAVADARDAGGEHHFHVIGVDLDTAMGRERSEAMNAGRFPFPCPDPALEDALARAHTRGNLIATTEVQAFALADVVVVDVNLDMSHKDDLPTMDFSGFRAAIRTLGEQLRPGALIIVETTTPPGTCEHIVAPELAKALNRRGLPVDAISLAHSYERVMPGPEYLESIVNYWRVYAGRDLASEKACAAFLEKVVDTGRFPLTRLGSMTASETAKVLENSYRAVTIAFMEEWGRFGEQIGIDMFGIVDAIRQRPTHSNMRQPGFGVGGYCLTKDPLFAEIAAREIFGKSDMPFAFCQAAIKANRDMPLVSLDRIEDMLGGPLDGRRLLLLGIAYRGDLADTRHSPSETFVRSARARGADVVCHDPLVRLWPEMEMEIGSRLPSPANFDAVVFAVRHSAYSGLNVVEWLGNARPLIFDANRVLDEELIAKLRRHGVRVGSIGRGATT